MHSIHSEAGVKHVKYKVGGATKQTLIFHPPSDSVSNVSYSFFNNDHIIPDGSFSCCLYPRKSYYNLQLKFLS